jgi:hypothetical protein
MEAPGRTRRGESLPESVFLLAFDLRRERLVGRGGLGYLLRAAALAELLTHGNLADDSGRPRTAVTPAGAGALQAALWERIENSPPRSWRHWITKDRALAFRLVRDELEQARLISVERRGMFRTTRIAPRRPYLSRRLAERVAQAVRGGRPVHRLEQDVRVLAALTAAAQLRAVLPAREWSGHRRRIEALSAPVEPVAAALRASLAAGTWAATSGG